MATRHPFDQESVGNRQKSKKKRVTHRYVVHEAHLSKWFDDYDDDIPPLEGRAEATELLNHIQEHLTLEFPHKRVPHTHFEYDLGSSSGSLRIPIRHHVCLASGTVSIVTRLSRMMMLKAYEVVPEDYAAPSCVIDCVTEAFTNALTQEFDRAKTNPRHPEGDTLGSTIYGAIADARDEAICAAVDALDGVTPDCNREYIQFVFRSRTETGLPDPFSSKSRFKNALIEALIWWQFSKEDYQEPYLQKSAEEVTEDDLAYYFWLIGYFGTNQRKSSDSLRPGYLDAGGSDRTIRRWLRKYSDPQSDWPSLRSALVTTIRRTGYHLI